MWAFFERLLDSSTLSPHGICLLWEPELIWLHVASDAVIAAFGGGVRIGKLVKGSGEAKVVYRGALKL